MRLSTIIVRSLAHYWRVNAAVVLGVAVAVAVLAGALVVGDSVRASLRGLLIERLGRADHLVTSQDFFRDQLAGEIERDEEFGRAGFAAAVPVVALEGVVTHEASGRRAGGVRVYGVDERFWRFHGVSVETPGAGEALLSPALAAEFGAGKGDGLLLRVEKPSDIPVESLLGRKDDVGSTVRLRSRGELAARSLGEFSLRAGQGSVRSIFVPLDELRERLGRGGRANAAIVSAAGEAEARDAGARTEALRSILKRRFTDEDMGVKTRVLEGRNVVAFETASGIVNDGTAAAALEAARRAGVEAAPVLSYLANSIRANGRDVPYSVVTAVDEKTFELIKGASRREGAEDEDRGSLQDGSQTQGIKLGSQNPAREAGDASLPPVILNEWAARELGARAGDRVALDYYYWEEGGRLDSRGAEFMLVAVVPIAGAAADQDLVPDYPGITGAESVAEWDPPFPVDLARVRPQDEDYWDEYKTTPKAFVPLARGQELWGTRFGKLTSLRLSATDGAATAETLARFRENFAEVSDPSQAGVVVAPVRAEGIEASEGATDFGEYFLYFSFFIVVSALLLAALFFRLGVEQRAREIGVLRAVGFTPALVRRVFLAEGLALAAAGSLLGLVGAYGYGALVMHGLRTWWVGAVGTTSLELHLTAQSLAAGAAGGTLAALVCVVLTLRGLRRASVRSLLQGNALDERDAAGARDSESRTRGRRFVRLPGARLTAVLAGAAGVLLLAAAASGWVGQATGFFGGGTLLLVALLCWQAVWLRGRVAGGVGGHGPAAVSRLGLRSATHRPGRSVLCITLIAAASFIIVAVDAFRQKGHAEVGDRRSGTGGYALFAESLLPVVHDPNAVEGREALNLSNASAEGGGALEGVSFARFRLRPGDDASCLNLYRPRDPRVLGATEEFLRENRFSFQSSLDAATPEEEANPWLLLKRKIDDGAVPVLADANSLTYVLHLKVGEDFVLERGGGGPVRLRVVAALAGSMLQGELLMAEENFTRLFPEREGYRLFLIDAPGGGEEARRISAALEESLGDYGFDAQPAAERLAGFHRVENTYLSTFQTLGGLGLALGTLGLAAVLLRNVFERRRELALLRAVGYGRGHFALMILAENALLLACGVATGTACALVAIAPAVSARGGDFPVAAVGALLLVVVVAGLAASLVATAFALRSPLIPALRSE